MMYYSKQEETASLAGDKKQDAYISAANWHVVNVEIHMNRN